MCRSAAVVNSQNSDTISRQSIESAQIIVGTSCAGTGLDIKNVGLIIVVGMPFSIEQLLQWAGRCRSSGLITVIVPSWQTHGGGELAGLNTAGRILDFNSLSWAGILRKSGTGQKKYEEMVALVDGAMASTLEIKHYSAIPDDFRELRNRIRDIKYHVSMLLQIHPTCCLVCSAIAKKKIHHTGGCPSVFNICFKCFGRHSAKTCSEPYFDVAKGFCFKCWMPLFDIFGISFHSKTKEDLITCSNSAHELVKPLVACFFHKREIIQLACPCGDRVQYNRWLFNPSQESVAGAGHIPNLLLILEAAATQLKDVVE
jgi:hypothetical protein